MKKLLYAVAILLLTSCTKQKFNEPISGIWTIVESNIGTGTGYTVQTYSPSSEITIEFGANGNLVLSGANPGLATSPLWEYNKYQLLSDNKIRFYQSGGSKEMEAFATVNGELFLNYLWARCGYEERFVKLR